MPKLSKTTASSKCIYISATLHNKIIKKPYPPNARLYVLSSDANHVCNKITRLASDGFGCGYAPGVTSETLAKAYIALALKGKVFEGFLYLWGDRDTPNWSEHSNFGQSPHTQPNVPFVMYVNGRTSAVYYQEDRGYKSVDVHLVSDNYKPGRGATR